MFGCNKFRPPVRPGLIYAARQGMARARSLCCWPIRHLIFFSSFSFSQLNTEWAQVEVVDLVNDGSGLGFGIIGGRSTGVVVKTIVPGGVSDRVR